MASRTRSRSPRAYVLRLPDAATQTVEALREQAPRRPGRRSHEIGDCFMMDFENSLLSEWIGAPPQGPRRFEVEAWAALVKRNVFPITVMSIGMSTATGSAAEEATSGSKKRNRL